VSHGVPFFLCCAIVGLELLLIDGTKLGFAYHEAFHLYDLEEMVLGQLAFLFH
jgi:hypothetical protein